MIPEQQPVERYRPKDQQWLQEMCEPEYQEKVDNWMKHDDGPPPLTRYEQSVKAPQGFDYSRNVSEWFELGVRSKTKHRRRCDKKGK